METVLVVDGSGVCRAPIVAFTLRDRFAGAGWLSEVAVLNRGMVAATERTMCESAAGRLGYTGPAIAFFGAHRASSLTVADIGAADLVLTAERAQRSAVVRMLPGTQALVFTWKEALVLANVLADRRRDENTAPPQSLADLARALHDARGAVPLIEPALRTGPFHFRRAAEGDPLTIESGHEGATEHRRVTQESVDVAAALAERFADLATGRLDTVALPLRGRRLRRTA